MKPCTLSLFFFFNDTATTEIYTLSLHDALPIYFFPTIPAGSSLASGGSQRATERLGPNLRAPYLMQSAVSVDRKSTRLNSSHGYISYAVFCLKKKKSIKMPSTRIFQHPVRHLTTPSYHHDVP